MNAIINNECFKEEKGKEALKFINDNWNEISSIDIDIVINFSIGFFEEINSICISYSYDPLNGEKMFGKEFVSMDVINNAIYPMYIFKNHIEHCVKKIKLADGRFDI